MVSDLHSSESCNGKSKRLTSNELFTKLSEVLKALEAFKNNYHKRLNVSLLARYLKLSNEDVDKIIVLILEFQRIFKSTLKDYHLKKKIIDSQIYFITEKEYEEIPKEVHMNQSHAKLLSDVIYTFKHVNRGKGFNLKFANTELLRNIKMLKNMYPYFFRVNGNNLTYPSEAGLRLGDIIISYTKTHKKLNDIKVENSHIIFE